MKSLVNGLAFGFLACGLTGVHGVEVVKSYDWWAIVISLSIINANILERKST